jgi:hypothetical protein
MDAHRLSASSLIVVVLIDGRSPLTRSSRQEPLVLMVEVVLSTCTWNANTQAFLFLVDMNNGGSAQQLGVKYERLFQESLLVKG